MNDPVLAADLTRSLAGAPLLEGVPGDELAWLLEMGEVVELGAGERITGELEPYEGLALVIRGRVRASVGADSSLETVLAELGPGAPLGEVGVLTGRVAAATLTAVERTTLFTLSRPVVLELMQREPAVARSLAAVLAERVRDTRDALVRALAADTGPAAASPAALRAKLSQRHRLLRLLPALLREALLEHSAELPFFFLTGFLAALILARVFVDVFRFEAHGLRDLYVTGLFLLIGTGASAHFVFHRTARRVLCATYGAALGFLANQLSVLLSFDVFYLDMTTRDPGTEVAMAELYDRAPTRYAVLLVAALALQAVYLRRFYRHAFFLLSERLRRRRAG